MSINRTTEEPQLELADIQGDVLVGLPKDAELFVGFVILDVPRFKRFLHGMPITTGVDAKRAEAGIAATKQNGSAVRLDIRGINIGFTFAGLSKLGAPSLDQIADEAFKEGLASRSGLLNDPPSGPGAVSNWLLGNDHAPLDGLVLLTGKDAQSVRAMFGELIDAAGPGTWLPFFTETGTTRPDGERGHEHFGYLDGVSQPAVRGRIDAAIPGGGFLNPNEGPDPNQGLPGADLHWPGAFVFGYVSPDPTDVETKGPVADGGAPWMRNGSYMVYRRFEQLVPEFDAAMTAKAAECPDTPERFGARVVGRFKSGWPVIETGEDDATMGGNKLVNNRFEFGDDDPDGARCPFAAHIRKSYPRNDNAPGGEPETQTHRIMRAGIPFGPEVQPDEQESGATRHSRGLMFVSYQTSIVEQFEFIMRIWVNNPDFLVPKTGEDPVLGQADGASRARHVRGLCRGNPASVTTFDADFVRPTGGGYFFMPSITALQTALSA